MKCAKILFTVMTMLALIILFSGIAVTQEPVEGGTLILRVPRELTLPELPPYAQAGGPEIAWPVIETLVWLDADSGEYKGCLAESWETSDFKEWTVNLRQGVKWHDGEPFTAEDVVFSFNLVANPAVPEVQMYSLNLVEGYEEYQNGKIDSLTGITAVDENTVTITLTKPSPQLLLTFARVPMLPSHLLKDLPVEENMEWDFWKNPIGTGPFSWAKRVPGEFVKFDKFADYWRQEPYLDSIVFKLYKEKGPFLLDLYAGRVHGASLVYPFTLTDDERETIKNDPNLQYLHQPGLTVRGLVFNMERMPNKEIRKALMLALDVPELDKIIGTVDPTRSVFAEPRFRSPDVDKAFKYDPEQAKQILEKEGWDFDREIKLVTYYTTKPFRDLLAAIQAYWARIGVKTKVFHMEVPVFIDTWYKKHDADILWAGFAQLPGFPSSEETFWSSDAMYPAGANISYENPNADEMLDQLSSTIEPQEKVELAHRFDEFAYNQFYHAVFYASMEEALINTRVHNFRMWLTVLAMDMKIDQWWMEPKE